MDKETKKVRGYMTIEASLLVPMMVIILILVIYWSFYIYNNCVVYQDCYISALRGCQMMDMSSDQISRKVYEYADDLLNNQLYQYQNKPEVDVGLVSVKVSASSSIDNKTKGFIEQNNYIFVTDREAKSTRIDPVWLIRNIY